MAKKKKATKARKKVSKGKAVIDPIFGEIEILGKIKKRPVKVFGQFVDSGTCEATVCDITCIGPSCMCATVPPAYTC